MGEAMCVQEWRNMELSAPFFWEPETALKNTAYLFIFKYLSIWLHRVLVAAYGISFPDQGSNPSPCVGSMPSQPLDYQGAPKVY